MDIISKTVRHKLYGEGRVCKLNNNIISVSFENEVRKFIFPDAFREHLFFADPLAEQYIKEIICEIDDELLQKRKAEINEAEKRAVIRSLPLNDNSQIAFGFLCNKRETVIKDWRVFSGRYLSGGNKGKPRSLTKAYPNTACLLTFCDKNEPEDNRYIWGAFMVKEDFIGPECQSGIITAHKKYRILLENEQKEKIKFWDYFQSSNEEPCRKWGSVEFKYFSNIKMCHILSDICKSLEETEKYSAVEEFFDYYCRINKISKSRF
ncbi:MAG: hypothetical protein VB078_10285 [Clostridiaceae bacterium]|nr:hypothetical protein [Clostridiaceae bacterium]